MHCHCLCSRFFHSLVPIHANLQYKKMKIKYIVSYYLLLLIVINNITMAESTKPEFVFWCGTCAEDYNRTIPTSKPVSWCGTCAEDERSTVCRDYGPNVQYPTKKFSTDEEWKTLLTKATKHTANQGQKLICDRCDKYDIPYSMRFGEIDVCDTCVQQLTNK